MVVKILVSKAHRWISMVVKISISISKANRRKSMVVNKVKASQIKICGGENLNLNLNLKGYRRKSTVVKNLISKAHRCPVYGGK